MVAGEKVNMITHIHACMSGLAMTFKILKMEVGGPLADFFTIDINLYQVCKIQEIEGKGRGLVLTRPTLEAGTLLVKEQALMVLRRDRVYNLNTVMDRFPFAHLSLVS